MGGPFHAAPLSGKQKSAFALFSLALACALVLSLHIQVSDPTWGGVSENTLTPYTLWDIPVLLLAFCGVFAVCAYLLFPALRRAGLRLHWGGAESRIPAGRFVLLCALILLCWLPWLVRCYPGFVFVDTEDSLLQALGTKALNNRNPVLFTLFLRLCLRLGGAFATQDVTLGCFLFSVLQMLFLSAVFSYSICWVMARFGLKSRWWIAALLLYYGANPYFAAFSVALWKDPVFSGAVLLLSLQLADYVLSEGASGKRGPGRFLLPAAALLCAFWRNNGFCALLGALALLLFSGRRGWKRPLLLVLGGCLALWALVFVFGFRLAGIGMPKEESAGLMLNQLARVAAYDGALSQEDAAYLDELFPLEAYREVYTPCCVDTLKWDGRFHYEALAGSRFLKTWVSVGLKNPLLYFEAWQLETYGFWSFTRPEALSAVQTLSDVAALYDASGARSVGGAVLHSRYTQETAAQTRLPIDVRSVPAGVLLWLLLFGLACNAAAGQRELSLLCGPCLGVLIGLILGSPIWYLPRYGACAQMLLPVLLLLPASRLERGSA